MQEFKFHFYKRLIKLMSKWDSYMVISMKKITCNNFGIGSWTSILLVFFAISMALNKLHVRSMNTLIHIYIKLVFST
jgi:hypothetical protein